MTSSPEVSFNAYVNLAFLQDELDQENRANAILVSGGQIDTLPDESASQTLQASSETGIGDLGLLLTDVSLDWESESDEVNHTVLKYHSLSSVKMMLDDDTVALAEHALGEEAQPVMTYLANALMKVLMALCQTLRGVVTEKRDPEVDGEIVPYSMITNRQ